MDRTPRRLSWLLAGLLVVSFACTDDDAGSADDVGTDPAADDAASSSPGDDDATDAAPEEPTHEAPYGRIELAGFQQTHASGTTVAVKAVEVDDHGHIYVEFDALAAGRRAARLASDGAHLEDDLGNSYEFVPPEANDTVALAQDQQADARLGFVGPIDPDATRVDFGLNGFQEFAPLDDRPARTQRPSYTFRDLPLPGTETEEEAAQSGETVGLDLSSAEVEVDEVVHEGPAEVRIEVTRVTVSPNLVEVDVFAQNLGDRERNLTQRVPELRAELDGASLGNDYPFEMVALTTDEGEFDRLTLAPGEEVEATFAFRGVVPPHATGVRLGFQVLQAQLDTGEASEEQQASNPSAVFTQLPIPEDRVGADLEVE